VLVICRNNKFMSKTKDIINTVGALGLCWTGLSAVANYTFAQNNPNCVTIESNFNFRGAPLEMIMMPDIMYLLRRKDCPLGHRLK
jgi:hypothetical protein